MQGLLSATCPWMQHLPGLLAQNPLLLLKVGSTELVGRQHGLCCSQCTDTTAVHSLLAWHSVSAENGPWEWRQQPLYVAALLSCFACRHPLLS